ncbi:MAG TPA: hypothetical protein VF721_13140 [Pyrinomonadaceae bacterium]|jgi:hypothetical protein
MNKETNATQKAELNIYQTNKKLLDDHKSIIVALEDYVVKPTQRENPQTAIDNYPAKTINSRATPSEGKTTIANFALFNKTHTILKYQTDKLVKHFRANNPDFVQACFSIREIIIPSAKPKRLKDIKDKKKLHRNRFSLN